MANEALQNQLLLDQMFARSVAPINQAIEVQRQRAQQQQDLERSRAQRERELIMEQTFRGQQQREALAAQKALAEGQQSALLSRDIEVEKRAETRARIKRINENPFASPGEKAKAKADPEYAAELDAQIVNREVEDTVKSLDAYTKQANAAMKEAIFSMATESKTIPPDVLYNASVTWLSAQDPKIRAVLSPIIMRGEQLTPKVVDEALNREKGMLWWGLNDDQIMTAALSYRTALAGVGGSKDPSPGVQVALAKYQSAKQRVENIASTPMGRIAANQYVQKRQAEDDAKISEYAKLQKEEEAAALRGERGFYAPNVPLTPNAEKEPPPVVPVEDDTRMGGVLGGVRDVAQNIPSKLSAAGNWIDRAATSAVDRSAGWLGGDYLVNQIQQGRARNEALRRASPYSQGVPMMGLSMYAQQMRDLRNPYYGEPPPVVPVYGYGEGEPPPVIPVDRPF